MEKISVKASTNYEIYIENGLLDKLNEYLPKRKSSRFLILTDENVYDLYFDKLKKQIESLGLSYLEFVVKAGEDSKTFETLKKLLEFMAENDINPNDILLAFGGGVIGDLGGFAAAIFRRGIDYIQIPTSLLAQVDSSVGGKTAVNLDIAKNMIGAFKQPLAVFCDPELLQSLTREEFACGMGEVIKYGILFDKDLFDLTENKISNDDKKLTQIIKRCIELKRDVVEEDEFDNGNRQLLNLGHTLAHAIEIKSNHDIKHGQAVAIGTFMIAKACQKKSILSSKNKEQIENAFLNNNLPIISNFKVSDMMDEISRDKKRRGSFIKEILIRDIGDCYLEKFDFKTLEKFLQEGQ